MGSREACLAKARSEYNKLHQLVVGRYCNPYTARQGEAQVGRCMLCTDCWLERGYRSARAAEGISLRVEVGGAGDVLLFGQLASKALMGHFRIAWLIAEPCEKQRFLTESLGESGESVFTLSGLFRSEESRWTTL